MFSRDWDPDTWKLPLRKAGLLALYEHLQRLHVEALERCDKIEANKIIRMYVRIEDRLRALQTIETAYAADEYSMKNDESQQEPVIDADFNPPAWGTVVKESGGVWRIAFDPEDVVVIEDGPEHRLVALRGATEPIATNMSFDDLRTLVGGAKQLGQFRECIAQDSDAVLQKRSNLKMRCTAEFFQKVMAHMQLLRDIDSGTLDNLGEDDEEDPDEP